MRKPYTVLLSCVLSLFVLLLLMLSHFSRLATDDYYFIWDVKHHGLVTGVTSQYMEWCGRFAATYAMDFFYGAFGLDHASYGFIPVLSAIFLFSGTYFLLKNLSSGYELKFSKQELTLTAGAFTALLFFLSPDIGETWFWFCAQSSYLWSIIAFTWCCVFLTGNRGIFQTLAAVICIIYVGAASEIYSVFYGLAFMALLWNFYKKAKSFEMLWAMKKQFVIVFCFFALSFLIFLVAPGNYLRDGLFPEHPFFYSFFITAKSLVKFAIFYLPLKLPFVFIFTVPFLLLGEASRTLEMEIFRVPARKFFFRTTGLFIAFLIVFFYLVAFVMVETGPPRIWLFVAFIFSIYCCYCAFYIGYNGFLSEKRVQFLKTFSAVLGICLILFLLVYEYPVASAYARAADLRESYLIKLNKTIDKDTLILLDPLPSPGMLYSTEITADTNHFTNREVRLGYELKYHVSLRN